jgi:trimeric autotransporter adhesin
VLINPSPIADAGPTATICSGGSAQLNASGGSSYSWTPATGLSNNAVSNPTATPSNTTLYTVVVGNNGCFSTDTVSVIVVSQITATASADVSICLGQSTQLTGGGGSTYTWTPATGLSATTIFNPVASPTVTTTYSVIVSAGSSCPTDTADVTVTVNPAFNISVSANDTICAGTSGTVSASGAATYTWSPGGSTSSSIVDAPVVTTTYTVSGSNGLCTDTATVSIVVLPSSVAEFVSGAQSELGNYSVCFTNSSAIFPGINCLWDFGDGDTSIAISPCHTYADAGTYNVCVTISSAFGCSDTYCEDVELKADWTFYVPNSFTPNGDFRNDMFYAYGSNLQAFEMFIYDRWGNNIYYSKDMSEGWNGTVNNKGAELVQIDTYVWKVKLKDSDGKQQVYVGHVNVVR